MQIPSSNRRNLGLAAIILVLLYTLFRIQHLPDDALQTSTHPSSASQQKNLIHPSQGSPCFTANFDVASETLLDDNKPVMAWFLNQDGVPTQRDVYINEGESTCIVVTLAPLVRNDPIEEKNRLDADDIIILTAVGKYTRFTIDLVQHPTHRSVYYAPVHFAHADLYQLEGRLEYRAPLVSFLPVEFSSANALRVRPDTSTEKRLLPACNLQDQAHHVGVWMSKSEYQRMYPFDFYGMFGDAQEDHAVNNRLFVPDQCRAQYVSTGQAVQCLTGKTIHVWGDNNIRRNIKAFSTANRWCDKPNGLCTCNDDEEDPDHTIYPWAVDANMPLKVNSTWNADTAIYFSHVDSLHQGSWKTHIQKHAREIAPADIVILGLGNADIQERTVTIQQFEDSVNDILSHILEHVYPTQRIVVRTPQPFFANPTEIPMWTNGRSTAFAEAIRRVVNKLNSHRVHLWDIHRLGLSDHTCATAGTVYSTRNVVQIENVWLWNLLCSEE